MEFRMRISEGKNQTQKSMYIPRFLSSGLYSSLISSQDQLSILKQQFQTKHKIHNFSSKINQPQVKSDNRNMSKSKGWTLQSSLLTLWMEKTRVNNQTKIGDDGNLLKTL